MKKRKVVRTEYIVRTTVKDGRDHATSEKVLTEDGMVEVLRALGYEVSDLPKRVSKVEEKVKEIERKLGLGAYVNDWV